MSLKNDSGFKKVNQSKKGLLEDIIKYKPSCGFSILSI